MGSQSIEKIDISRILIHSSDGSASTARVTSMEAANSVLQSWAHGQSGKLSAACEVEIVFEDGLRYHGHYGLKEHEKSVSLNRHVRRQLAAMTKKRCTKKGRQPAHESAIFPEKADMAECARTMLAHYNI
jgi:hypothetical protein